MRYNFSLLFFIDFFMEKIIDRFVFVCELLIYFISE